ncbi:MAG: hypothetical protein IPK46_14170 [Saprospiraceae bacterium]|nr:hypothetical protein [Saprospiraceae bacterium]
MTLRIDHSISCTSRLALLIRSPLFFTVKERGRAREVLKQIDVPQIPYDAISHRTIK